jgi:hypothetical protein
MAADDGPISAQELFKGRHFDQEIIVYGGFSFFEGKDPWLKGLQRAQLADLFQGLH